MIAGTTAPERRRRPCGDASRGRACGRATSRVPAGRALRRALAPWLLALWVAAAAASAAEPRTLRYPGSESRRDARGEYPREAIARSERSGQTLALMFLDLDRFKQINDSLGHQTGDRVLQEFAARLLASVRQTDTVARLAGDEFVIALEALHPQTAREEVEAIARKILAAMAPALRVEEALVTLSTSIGIALRRVGETEPAALLQRADAALYAAKRAGRGTWRFDDA